MNLVNVVIAQGGGPTSVINGTLAAAIREYQKGVGGKIGRIYVALNGADGLLGEELVDVTEISESDLDNLEQTICAAAGSARTKMDNDSKRGRLIDVLERHNIHILNLIGGGDTASTVAEINKVAEKRGYNLISEHIMKTIDNDGYGLFSPGWGTTGVWERDATLSLIKEIEAMPGAALGVSMGRDSGWITAMTTHAFLAEGKDKRYMQKIYTPETGFTLEGFVDECCDAYVRAKGRLVVNLSEGVQEDGCDVSFHQRLVEEEAQNRELLSKILGYRTIVDQICLKFGSNNVLPLVNDYAGVADAGLMHDDHGNIAYGEIRTINLADFAAGYLQAAMIEKLGLQKLRVRGNTYGYPQRCPQLISYLDLLGGKLVGQKAAQYAFDHISGRNGNSQVNETYGKSVVLKGAPGKDIISDKMEAEVVDLDKIANLETGKGIQYQMPAELMTRDGPTDDFIEYSRPLIECEIIRVDPRRFVSFTDDSIPMVKKKLPAYKAA